MEGYFYSISCCIQEGGLGGEDSPSFVQTTNGTGVSIKVDVGKLVDWVFRMSMIWVNLTPIFVGDTLLDKVICQVLCLFLLSLCGVCLWFKRDRHRINSCSFSLIHYSTNSLIKKNILFYKLRRKKGFIQKW